MKKYLLILLISVLLLPLGGCGKKVATDYEVSPEVKGSSNQQIPFDIIKNGYTKGPDDARVTIVEFSDFQCPACGQMADVIEKIIDAYPNDARLVYRHFPLSYHQYAMSAAKAAEAAGLQGKFWEMYSKLFGNQQKLSDDIFVTYANDLGLDIDKFNQDLVSAEIENKIKDDLSDGSNLLKIGGTPTFYINNVEYTGQYSVGGFKKEIDKILAEK